MKPSRAFLLAVLGGIGLAAVTLIVAAVLTRNEPANPKFCEPVTQELRTQGQP